MIAVVLGTIDPPIPTITERSTSGFIDQANIDICLYPVRSTVRCSAAAGCMRADQMRGTKKYEVCVEAFIVFMPQTDPRLAAAVAKAAAGDVRTGEDQLQGHKKHVPKKKKTCTHSYNWCYTLTARHVTGTRPSIDWRIRQTMQATNKKHTPQHNKRVTHTAKRTP